MYRRSAAALTLSLAVCGAVLYDVAPKVVGGGVGTGLVGVTVAAALAGAATFRLARSRAWGLAAAGTVLAAVAWVAWPAWRACASTGGIPVCTMSYPTARVLPFAALALAAGGLAVAAWASRRPRVG